MELKRVDKPLPQVNLLRARAPSGQLPRLPLKEVGLVALALLSWGVAAVGIAILLGWHPRLP